MGSRWLRLTDEQRRRLAAKERVLGWRVLAERARLVTPDPILRWHLELIASAVPCGKRNRPQHHLQHGLEPAPSRGKGMAWGTFNAHLGMIAAADLFTVEVLTVKGLVR
ncbi:MAG TPA: hypothetical protein VMK12_26520 [Anaeromyxobacteraceae bacterium]|nr:hypothetical protein [Anaeromyxobacteraceae bacterium]